VYFLVGRPSTSAASACAAVAADAAQA